MTRMKKRSDPRITARHISVGTYLWILIVLMILSAAQAMIYSAFVPAAKAIPLFFTLGMVGYWAIVALVFCLFAAGQRYRSFSRPMVTLSEATKRVADGDYTVRLQPLRKDGKKDYVEVMFDDFNKMVSELNSTELMKNDFIANVSHELKTPLSVIQSYATALQSNNLSSAKQKEYTTTIVEASQKLTNLVTNILKLNKLENQEIVSSRMPFDLNRQLSECALSFEDSWMKKNIMFIVEMEDRMMINLNEEMLEIVWNNLFSNAIKFTDSGGIIKLIQFSSQDTVTVVVQDNGCGMNEETKKHVFDKFFQGDTSHAQEGNGLGLALSFRVIEMLGGIITVESNVDVGTTFTVILPRDILV